VERDAFAAVVEIFGLDGAGHSLREAIEGSLAVNDLDRTRTGGCGIADVIGRGLTSSGRHKKVGAYLSRMTPHHFDLLCNETFQKLVVEFGYEPTRRIAMSRRNRTVAKINKGLAAIRNILPARSASGSF